MQFKLINAPHKVGFIKETTVKILQSNLILMAKHVKHPWFDGETVNSRRQ